MQDKKTDKNKWPFKNKALKNKLADRKERNEYFYNRLPGVLFKTETLISKPKKIKQ